MEGYNSSVVISNGNGTGTRAAINIPGIVGASPNDIVPAIATHAAKRL